MNIPTEIIDHISAYITDQRHQANVALVNKAWNLSMTPVLYREIDFDEFPHDGQPAQVRESGELPRLYGIAWALAKNPFLSSLVHSIRHCFCVSSHTGAPQRHKWEISLLRIRLHLQEIIDRNGFPRVEKLVFFSPDVEIAEILLNGLLPQIQNLHITSPFFKYLGFDAGNSLGFKNLGEVGFEFAHDRRGGASGLMTEGRIAAIRDNILADKKMHYRLNYFFSHCPSLRILKINGTKELHTLLKSVTFPCLKVLEVGPIFNQRIDFAVDGLNSFLERHSGVSRLALYNLPNETSCNLTLSEASRLNIREFISSIEEVPSDYVAFLRQFRRLETYRLKYHIIVGEVMHNELLNLLPELQSNSPGIKNLTLPMPSHIPGWMLTDQKKEMARNALMEFGEALTEFLPTVERFGICQTGRFFYLEAADWAQSFASHPSLRNLVIRTAFLPNISVHESEDFRRDLINQLALEFAAIPKLESLVFLEGMDNQITKVEIVRMEDGSVEGKETPVYREEVEVVFFDEVFISDNW